MLHAKSRISSECGVAHQRGAQPDAARRGRRDAQLGCAVVVWHEEAIANAKQVQVGGEHRQST
jgi:hypothetical protein